jgi:uncharacterized protein
MTPMLLKCLLGDAQSGLRDIFGDKLKRMTLYGSYARGDFNDRSDIDIIALIDGDVKQHQHQVVRLNVDLSLLYDVETSIMLEEKENFNTNAGLIPLFRNIEKEGVNIYAV